MRIPLLRAHTREHIYNILPYFYENVNGSAVFFHISGFLFARERKKNKKIVIFLRKMRGRY